MQPDVFTKSYGEHEIKMVPIIKAAMNNVPLKKIAIDNNVSVVTVSRYIKKFKGD